MNDTVREVSPLNTALLGLAISEIQSTSNPNEYLITFSDGVQALYTENE